ncbi:MAG: TIGR02391 family protein [Balneolaceae bacterium]
MSSKKENKSAGIQYLGLSASTRTCKDAIICLIQSNKLIEKARLLTSSNRHCFLLMLEQGEKIAIKPGFTSGYGGEGPSALSYIITLFEAFDIEIDEIDVDDEVIYRVDYSCLSDKDLEVITESRAKHPNRVFDYVIERDLELKKSGNLWKSFKPVIPFSIIDHRLSDLAISFWDSPDEKILIGYRRFEDTIRKRTGINEHGAKLFSEAYRGKEPKLTWDGLKGGELDGRIQLMIGSFMSYRNPRAHRESKHSAADYLLEFLLLNHLYKLERESVDVS